MYVGLTLDLSFNNRVQGTGIFHSLFITLISIKIRIKLSLLKAEQIWKIFVRRRIPFSALKLLKWSSKFFFYEELIIKINDIYLRMCKAEWCEYKI